MAEDFISGALAGQQYKQNQIKQDQGKQLFQLSLEEGKLEVEEKGLKLEQLKRITDIQKLAYDKAQKSPSNATSSSFLYPQLRLGLDVAMNKIEMGDIEGGTKELKALQGIEENQLKVTRSTMNQASQRAQNVQSMLYGINKDDPPEVAQRKFDANVTAFMATGQEIDPEALQRTRQDIGDPAFRDRILQVAQTEKKKADTDYARAKAEREQFGIVMDKSHKVLYDAEAARQNQLRTAGEKNGNKPIPAPLITAAVNKIRAMRPLGKAVDDDKMKVAAIPMAQEIQELMKDGYTEEQAINKAWEDNKDEMHFRTGRPARGTTPDRPLPVPMLQGKIDPAKLEDGVFYKGLGYWDEDSKSFQTDDDDKAPPTDEDE